jgi:hypothetical protein
MVLFVEAGVRQAPLYLFLQKYLYLVRKSLPGLVVFHLVHELVVGRSMRCRSIWLGRSLY